MAIVIIIVADLGLNTFNLFYTKAHIWIFIPFYGPHVQNIEILLYTALANAMRII